MSVQSMRSREETLISMIDTDGVGLEIGPGYNPLLSKSAGFRVETVDYAGRDELVRKYAGNELVDTCRIEEVDYVTGGRPILDAIPHRHRYDYIVASHVIEHVPDLIGFLNSCEELLSPVGVLALAVPDKRCCFDLFQPLSSTGDVLQAFLEKRQRPQAGKVFDSVAYDVLRDKYPSWTREQQARPVFNADLQRAKYIFDRINTKEEYIDVHVWRFVPSSFRLMIEDLWSIEMIRLREVRIGLGITEFFVSLSRAGEGAKMSRIDLAIEAAKEHAQFVST